MSRFIYRRIALAPVVLAAANFVGFIYAVWAAWVVQSQNPFGTSAEQAPPVLSLYTDYARGLLHFDLGNLPIGNNLTVASLVGNALLSSLGLLALAFGLSVLFGLALGMAAVRVNPARVRAGLIGLSTLGLAMPSFYLGTLWIALAIFFISRLGVDFPIPIIGFGWDLHLVFPVLALMLRPTMQIAQVTASLLVGELEKQYVVAERGFGYSWNAIRWRKALKNVLASLLLSIAGSLRLTITELLLVEWLFNWPGVGRLLVMTLVPPQVAGPRGSMAGATQYFLFPPLVAALLALFALVFYVVDSGAGGLARAVDPRLQAVDEQVRYD